MNRNLDWFRFWLLGHEDDDPAKAEPAHLHAIMNRNLDWFRFWLLGHEDDDPAKAEQYARWRGLRSPSPS